MKQRSKFEGKVQEDLLKRGKTYEYEPIKLTYTLANTYTPDIVLPNKVIVELKGFFKPSDRRKMLAVTTQHPDLDIRMVFQNPYKKLSKTSKTTYADWCDKHNIKWASGVIPEEWFSESDTD